MQSCHNLWLNRLFTGLNSIWQKYLEPGDLQIAISATKHGFHKDQALAALRFF